MTDWIEANGASFRYDLVRRGAPATLVLVHEIGGAIESWDESLPVFTAHFDVLRYDQRGFGLSEKADALDIDGIVADLAALLDALGLHAPVCLAGAAMGAGIALAFAHAHPARARGLAIASPALGYPPGAPLAVLEQRADIVAREGMRATTDLGFERSYPEALRDQGEARARFERYRRRWLGNDPQGLAAVSRVASRMHLQPLLATLRCPTLVMGCSHDPIRPAAQSRAIAGQIPGARFTEIAAGHFAAVQAPLLFARTASDFLRALP
ncbi:MAG: alpha/beta fold hydrolase [Xenophilus sp.]